MNVHPTSWIASETILGAGCTVHPFACIGLQPMRSSSLARLPEQQLPAEIGSGCMIGAHAVISAGVIIGDGCLIGEHAAIREGVIIGDNCVIGQGVSVHYEALIEDDVRIINGTHITGGMRIGRGTFIGVGVVTANDRRREIVDYRFIPDAITPPVVGERCLIGSGAVLLPGISIGDGAIVGAGAVVTKDVPAGGRAMGSPAERHDRFGYLITPAQDEASRAAEMAYRMERV